MLDVLFVRKDPSTGELQTMDIQSEELRALAGTVTLGVSRREIEGSATSWHRARPRG